MINLMPVDLWLEAMHQDLDEDDIDEYGRLIIDLPDGSDSADNTKTDKGETSNENIHFRSHTELRGNKPTLVKEKIISTHAVTEPPISSLRINRDIPIKLILKRRFQNGKSKPQNVYKTEDAKEQINESGIEKIVNEYKSNKLREDETKEKNTLVDDYNLIVANSIENRTIMVSSNNSQLFETHESLSPAVSKTTDKNVNQRVSKRNCLTLKTSIVAAEKLNTLNQFEANCKENLVSTHTKHSNQEEKQNTTCIVVDNIVQKNSYPNHAKKMVSHVTPEKNNNIDVSLVSEKEKVCSHKRSQRFKNLCSPHVVIDTIDLTVTPSDHVMEHTPSALIAEKQNTTNENNTDPRSPQMPNLSQIEQETTVITHSKQYYKNNIKKNTLDAQISSNRFRRTSKQKYKPRISVVSNEFLYQTKQKTPRRPRKNIQTQKKYKRSKSPQKYQDALVEFMTRQYHLAIRKNLPLTVNRKPLYQEIHKQNPDTFFTEVIHVDPRQQTYSNLTNQNINQPRIPNEKTLNSASEPGYNILVHQGPDINRIVITIANKNENINQTVNFQSSSDDQRVPESTMNNTFNQLSQSSQTKRPYFYKEPSLRTFRKRLCNGIDKQIRDRVQKCRIDSPNNDMAYNPNFINDVRKLDLPSLAIENFCYTYQPLYQIYGSVTNSSCPWELYKTRLVQSDEISRRITDIPCRPPQFHLDSYECGDDMRSPLNLSLKPLPKFCPTYPVQDYY